MPRPYGGCESWCDPSLWTSHAFCSKTIVLLLHFSTERDDVKISSFKIQCMQSYAALIARIDATELSLLHKTITIHKQILWTLKPSL